MVGEEGGMTHRALQGTAKGFYNLAGQLRKVSGFMQRNYMVRITLLKQLLQTENILGSRPKSEMNHVTIITSQEEDGGDDLAQGGSLEVRSWLELEYKSYHFLTHWMKQERKRRRTDNSKILEFQKCGLSLTKM